MQDNYEDIVEGNIEAVNHLLQNIALPSMIRVRQHFPTVQLEHPEKALMDELNRPEIRTQIKPNMKTAVTAGSRGLNNYVPLLLQIIGYLKEMGAEPFRLSFRLWEVMAELRQKDRRRF